MAVQEKIVSRDARVSGAMVDYVLRTKSKFEAEGLTFSDIQSFGSEGFIVDKRQMYFTVSGPASVVRRYVGEVQNILDARETVEFSYVTSKKYYEVTADLFEAHFDKKLKKPRRSDTATTKVITSKAKVNSFKRAMAARGVSMGAVQ